MTYLTLKLKGYCIFYGKVYYQLSIEKLKRVIAHPTRDIKIQMKYRDAD